MAIVDVGTGTLLYDDFTEGSLEAGYEGLSLDDIYRSKCIEHGLDPDNSLYTMGNYFRHVVNFNMSFSPFPTGGSTRVTWSTEGLLHLYYTSSNNVGFDTLSSDDWDITLGSIVKIFNGFSDATPVELPSLTICCGMKSLLARTTDDDIPRMQHNDNALVLIVDSYALSNTSKRVRYLIEIKSSGIINLYVENYNNTDDILAGIYSFNQSSFSGTHSNQVANTDNSRIVTIGTNDTAIKKFSTVPLVSYVITGNVNSSGVAYSNARVSLLKQSTLAVVSNTTPDVNGEFSFNVLDLDEYIIICEDLAPSNPKNALIFDRVVGT